MIVLLFVLVLFGILLAFLKPREMNQGPKRVIIENFLTEEECSHMIQLIDDKMATGEYVPKSPLDTGEQQIFKMNSFHNSKVDEIRSRVSQKIRELYKDNSIGIESSYMKGRRPGPGDAHPLHVDSLEVDEESREVCTWLSHSVLLYLNESDGGDLFFDDGERTYVKPKPGLLTIFTSGPENPHGVTRINSGARYAILLWFTRDYFHKENY